jgi:anti-sigma B factor antagonist
MKMDSTHTGDGLLCINLEGRLDIDGALAVEDRFAFTTTTSKESVIVDLNAVSFLASIGIRMLMTAARAKQSRGGKLVLAAAQPAVNKVLVMAGIDQLIPLYDTLEQAQVALKDA